MGQKAWIIGAYGNNGGNNMNYHIAKLCKEFFNLETGSVSSGNSTYTENNVFKQQNLFKEYTINQFLKLHSEKDILISNPSFSPHLLGHKSSCKKIMYVQGFSTFRIIDAKFDKYIAVSKFVQHYLKSIFNIDSNHLPAFINKNSDYTPFENKKDAIILYKKDDHDSYYFFREEVKKQLKYKGSNLEIHELERNDLQLNILDQLDKYKYFLTLSEAEGFGLVPLEAMSLGLVVFGFNGYGGKDYMDPSTNCVTNEYPDVDQIVDSIIHVSNDQKTCQYISQRAVESANSYSKERFLERWKTVLEPYINTK